MSYPAISEELRHIWRVAYATAYATSRPSLSASQKAHQQWAGRIANEAVQGACDIASEPWGNALDRTMAKESIGDVDDCLEHIARGGRYHVSRETEAS